jgi:NitT/TauT family transport system substrate-binding protein
MEGFTEVEYVPTENASQTGPSLVAQGKADMLQWDVVGMFPELDEGKPLVLLAGVHSGCQEIIGNGSVASIRDLKGKRVGVSSIGGADHLNIASILAYVGIDPTKDIKWISGQGTMDASTLFARNAVDAFIGFAPQPQILRRKRIGHTLVSTALDKPWSQYFCCMLGSNRDFARQNPIATKRAMRAILKAADICTNDPQRVAKFMAEKGYQPEQDISLEVLKELEYSRWREANPEDSIRFHALRLYEVGMIKTNPSKLIAQGKDWRFLNELKKGLKA